MGRSISRSRSRSKDKRENRRKYSKEYKHISHKSKSYHREKDEDTCKLFISNIPSNIPDRKIKEEFENFAEVIDINIKGKNNNKTYCYCYLKLKNKEDAEKIIQGFRNKK